MCCICICICNIQYLIYLSRYLYLYNIPPTCFRDETKGEREDRKESKGLFILVAALSNADVVNTIPHDTTLDLSTHPSPQWRSSSFASSPRIFLEMLCREAWRIDRCGGVIGSTEETPEHDEEEEQSS